MTDFELSKKPKRDLPTGLRKKGNNYYSVFKIAGKSRWVPRGADQAEAIRVHLRDWATYKTTSINTVEALIADFLMAIRDPQNADYRDLSEATKKDYERDCRILVEVFGKMAIGRVKTRHIFEYRHSRRTAPVRCNREMSTMTKLLNHALMQGLIDENVAKAYVKWPEKKRDRAVSPEEIAQLIEVSSPPLRAYLQIKWLTGARSSEVLRLKWEDVTETHLHLSITKQKNKSQMPRRVRYELTPELRRAVEYCECLRVGQAKNSPWLIPTRNGTQFTYAGIRNHFEKARKILLERGVEYFRDHDLRTGSAIAAGSLSEAQQLLGHTTATTTQQHYYPKIDDRRPLSTAVDGDNFKSQNKKSKELDLQEKRENPEEKS